MKVNEIIQIEKGWFINKLKINGRSKYFIAYGDLYMQALLPDYHDSKWQAKKDIWTIDKDKPLKAKRLPNMYAIPVSESDFVPYVFQEKQPLLRKDKIEEKLNGMD